jgi:hypothetical protein
VCEVYADLGILSPVLRLAIPDCFVPHGATSQLLSDIGLTPDGVHGAVLGRLLDLAPEAGPSGVAAAETRTDGATPHRRGPR